MRERRWLYLALGATAVLSLGAVAPLAGAGVAVSEKGIGFPDGTFQETACAGGELVQGSASVDIAQLDDCSAFTALFSVPADKVLEISWLSVVAFAGADVDPVRVWIRTWTGPGASIDHPVVLLQDLIRVGPEIFLREGWHSNVALTSVEGETVQVWACNADYLSSMTVTVTFTGRLYDAP